MNNICKNIKEIWKYIANQREYLVCEIARIWAAINSGADTNTTNTSIFVQDGNLTVLDSDAGTVSTPIAALNIDGDTGETNPDWNRSNGIVSSMETNVQTGSHSTTAPDGTITYAAPDGIHTLVNYGKTKSTGQTGIMADAVDGNTLTLGDSRVHVTELTAIIEAENGVKRIILMPDTSGGSRASLQLNSKDSDQDEGQYVRGNGTAVLNSSKNSYVVIQGDSDVRNGFTSKESIYFTGNDSDQRYSAPSDYQCKWLPNGLATGDTFVSNATQRKAFWFSNPSGIIDDGTPEGQPNPEFWQVGTYGQTGSVASIEVMDGSGRAYIPGADPHDVIGTVFRAAGVINITIDTGMIDFNRTANIITMKMYATFSHFQMVADMVTGDWDVFDTETGLIAGSGTHRAFIDYGKHRYQIAGLPSGVTPAGTGGTPAERVAAFTSLTNDFREQ